MNWNIDGSHTSTELSVKHMGLFTVKGTFDRVRGTAETSEDGRLVSVYAEFDADSINTRDANRDGHLRSADFLDAENYDKLVFRSTEIRQTGGNKFQVTGDLTIRDQTQPVTFEAETTEPFKDPFGLLRAGASLTGKISRKQWGLTWNNPLDNGGVVLSDEVKFNIDVQAVAEVPATVSA